MVKNVDPLGQLKWTKLQVELTPLLLSNLSKLDKNLDVPVKGVNKTTGEQQNGADAFKQKLVAAMAEKLNPNIEKNKTKEESRDA